MDGERFYLLVLEGHSSSICPLPHEGSLRMGRATDVELRLEDPSVSRYHARLVVAHGEARVSDLGSHNGVRVNGETIDGARLLHSGDVLTLGSVTLVFHRGSRPLPERPVLDDGAFRQRLTEELERVLGYERTLSVVVLEPGPASVSLEALVRTASGSLRLMDTIGRTGNSQLAALLPELASDEVEEATRHLLESLAPHAPRARAGVATAPHDGMDAEALLAAARAAALAAPAGQVRTTGPGLYRLTLGERSVVVADAAMVRLYELLQRLAANTLPVLIHGETGSGKENAAWAVHHGSPRASGPFVVLNCAALPDSLVESELFGYEKGAFSGAASSRPGLLESASGGTLFLDEVAELSLPVQAKLLRVLDNKPFTRLGSTRERQVDLRIVAATHRVLADEVRAGRFRQDLFFRLSAAVVMLPPLRERPREQPLLARAFLDELCARMGRPAPRLSAQAMGVLNAYPWPGNVRELKNAMEYAAATATGTIIEASHLPDSVRRGTATASPAPEAPPPASPPEPARAFRPIHEEIRELERQRMSEALEAAGGVQTRAAQLIGMPLRTFVLKLKQYQLSPRSQGAS